MKSNLNLQLIGVGWAAHMILVVSLVPNLLFLCDFLLILGGVRIIVKRLGLGPGTWDLGPGTWNLGPGNRIENRESKIENRKSKLPPVPGDDSKMPGATTTTTHPPPPNF